MTAICVRLPFVIFEHSKRVTGSRILLGNKQPKTYEQGSVLAAYMGDLPAGRE
jgi:hypothetical protein